MIRFEQVLGQRGAVELLRRMLDTGRVPHALLFHGPEGVGKRTVASSFAAALLCASPGLESCGTCSACRLAEGGNHPDLFVVERLPRKPRSSSRGSSAPPSDGELRNFILVDQIRQLSSVAALAPRQSAQRVFIIDPADRMNPEAQNALLKTLEEPPGSSVLILIASRPQLLLPTVRSRTFSLSFGPIRPVELAALLSKLGIDPQEAAARASLAGGRPGRALQLDIDELLEWRLEVLGTLERLTRSPADAAELPALAAQLAGKGEARILGSLELLEALIRDAALSAAGSDPAALTHADLADRLHRLGARLGAQRGAEIIGAIERLRHELRFNLNRTLVVESLLAAVAGGPIP